MKWQESLIRFELWDWDLIGKNDPLGWCELEMWRVVLSPDQVCGVPGGVEPVGVCT